MNKTKSELKLLITKSKSMENIEFRAKVSESDSNISKPHFADRSERKIADQTQAPQKEKQNNSTDPKCEKLKSFAEFIKATTKSQNTQNTPLPINANEKKEEIHKRIFHTITYTPDQSPSGIEKKVTEIMSTITKQVGPGGIVSIQYKGRGQFAVEMKTKELLQKVTTSGLHFPGDNQRAPLKPRRNPLLLITIKTDASTLNEEIVNALSPYGKITNINYGYYNNNRQIRDGRRLVHIIPTVNIDKIPHTVQIDYRVHHLYFRGKTTPTKPAQEETEALLQDLELSDSDLDTEEMTLDETETNQPQNPKDETKTPQPPTDTINTIRDPSTDKPEKIDNTLEKPKPSTQLPIAIITKQRTEQATAAKPQVTKTPEKEKKQNTHLETAQNETLTVSPLPNTPMETDNIPSENTQKPTKRKSETTLTKNDKQSADNPNKTKRKPHRI